MFSRDHLLFDSDHAGCSVDAIEGQAEGLALAEAGSGT